MSGKWRLDATPLEDEKQREPHSRSTIYSKLRHNPKRPSDYDPTFPRPISIGAKAVGWIESEVEHGLAAQIKKSRKA